MNENDEEKADRARRDDAISKLKEKLKNINCPACNNPTKWQMGIDNFMGLSSVVVTYPRPGESGYITCHRKANGDNVDINDLLVPASCSCGYVMLFFADKIGAEPRGPK